MEPTARPRSENASETCTGCGRGDAETHQPGCPIAAKFGLPTSIQRRRDICRECGQRFGTRHAAGCPLGVGSRWVHGEHTVAETAPSPSPPGRWRPRWVYRRDFGRLLPYCTVGGGSAEEAHQPEDGQIVMPELTEEQRAMLGHIVDSWVGGRSEPPPECARELFDLLGLDWG